jgi:hypothetical protein
MADSQHQATPPVADTPPPVPWAMDALYATNLPLSLSFPAAGGFTSLVRWIRNLAANPPASTPPGIKICALVPSYPDGKTKSGYMNQAGLSPTDKEEYEAAATLSAAIKEWRAGGTIGLVTSSLSDAVALSTGQNNWHTVAVVRIGSTVWIHDPAYQFLDHKGKTNRMDSINGTKMVYRMVQEWKAVTEIWVQGPDPKFAARLDNNLDCMGRSAQWIDATVSGQLPWPPNRDASGGVWIQYLRN